MNIMYYIDRHDAGKKLAKELNNYRGQLAVIVLAIPRGGVVIGYEIARALNAPLDIVVTKKIGAPDNPEFAIGAVNLDGQVILDESVVGFYGVGQQYIDDQVIKLRRAMREKQTFLRGKRKYPDLTGKIVILTDDGIATGQTLLAAIEFVKKRKPKKLIVAVPVAAVDSVGKIKKQVDELICPYTPSFFGAVGNFYQKFDQTEDLEAKGYLDELAAALKK